MVSLARLTLVNCRDLASVASGIFLRYQLSQKPTNTQLSLFHQHPEAQRLMAIFCSYLATDKGSLKRFCHPQEGNQLSARICLPCATSTTGSTSPKSFGALRPGYICGAPTSLPGLASTSVGLQVQGDLSLHSSQQGKPSHPGPSAGGPHPPAK